MKRCSHGFVAIKWSRLFVNRFQSIFRRDVVFALQMSFEGRRDGDDRGAMSEAFIYGESCDPNLKSWRPDSVNRSSVVPHEQCRVGVGLFAEVTSLASGSCKQLFVFEVKKSRTRKVYHERIGRNSLILIGHRAVVVVGSGGGKGIQGKATGSNRVKAKKKRSRDSGVKRKLWRDERGRREDGTGQRMAKDGPAETPSGDHQCSCHPSLEVICGLTRATRARDGFFYFFLSPSRTPPGSVLFFFLFRGGWILF